MSRAKHELSLTNRDSYGGNTLTKIRKDIGCDYVVVGSYLAIGQAGKGRVRLDARVEDALTGDTVASFAVVGSQSDLFNLASRAGEQLRAKLGAETLTLTEAEEVKLALPSDPEAARLYSDPRGAAADLLANRPHRRRSCQHHSRTGVDERRSHTRARRRCRICL